MYKVTYQRQCVVLFCVQLIAIGLALLLVRFDVQQGERFWVEDVGGAQAPQM